MAKYIDTKKKPKFYKFLRFFVTKIYKKRSFLGVENLPSEPSIVVGNHAQLHSPMACEFDFPAKKYIWCIGQMMNKKEVPAYAYQDFWSEKPKGTRWFWKMFAHLIGPFAAYLMNHADTIAVYKDTRIITTYKDSMKGLNEGAHIVLFPEHRKPFNNIVNDFQDKFVDTARMYYKKTGKVLSFVPMYHAVSLKKIVLGKPIKFDPNDSIENQRKIICDYLKNEITKLALELPAHRVVPYENIPKKKQKFSK